jgi:acyl dehydratase
MPVSFEDFPAGRVITTSSITVTETQVVQWAQLTGDWYPLHTDAVFAAQTEFGARIAHGPLTFALAVGLVAQSGALGDAAIAWLGADNLKAHAPVFIGDTVSVTATVIDARRTSKSDRGVVTLRYVVANSSGTDVLSCDFTLLMRAESADRPT